MLNVGAVVSTTVTNWEAVAILPAASDADHVTKVVPIEKLVGALFVNTIALLAVQLSVAFGAVNVIVAVQPAPALAVMAAGEEITG